MGHVTLTTPFNGWLVIQKIAFDKLMILALAVRASNFKGSRDPDHAPFKSDYRATLC